jgi:hypothetical protein
MIRKVKCKNCQLVKTEKGTLKCYGCNVTGCNKCIETVCCDCSEIMCKHCGGSGDVRCGCYGNCSSCKTDVDRGSDGWPCSKCKKWYCEDCKKNSKCKLCKINYDD